MILLIDDDPTVRTVIARMLEDRGHCCAQAGDVASACAQLDTQAHELLICDLGLPDASGLEIVALAGATTPFTPTLVISGRDDPAEAASALELGAYGYLVKPFTANELVIAVRNALRRRELELAAERGRCELEERVAERTADLAHANEETVRRLARAIEYRDPETGGHVERMSRYCGVVGDALGIDGAAMQSASRLHDVGKIGVPDHILLKPGPLSREEYAVMQTHAAIGHQILTGSGNPLLELAATIALTHHERLDGSGYPYRLVGAEIPLAGRIAAVCDVFDAVTSQRVYRSPASLEEGVGALLDGSGSLFDPEVVTAFIANLPSMVVVADRHTIDAA